MQGVNYYIIQFMTRKSRAFLLDVDGVITDPERKSVKPEMIEALIERLRAGEPVALVSGRAMNWLLDRVVNPLVEKVHDSKLLERLIVFAEFGGSRVWFENGQQKRSLDREMSVPDDIAKRAKDIALEFSDFMFVDPDKKTMVSVEMRDGLTVEEFKIHQDELDKRLQVLVDEAGIGREFEVHSDTIATNLRARNSNKGQATKQVLEWIRSAGIKPSSYYAVGDASSDKEMFDEIINQRLNGRFIFVGGRERLNLDDKRITYTNSRYDEGVIEFLKTL